MGDLNVNGREELEDVVQDSLAYRTDLIDILTPWICHDLLREFLGFQPITVGDYYKNLKGKRVPLETCFTRRVAKTKGLRMDYLLLLRPSSQGNQTSWSYRLRSANVEKFQVSEQPFTQISDHYGVSATIDFLNVNRI